MTQKNSLTLMSACITRFNCKPIPLRKIGGISLAEVMLATFMISIALVPAIEALSGAMLGSSIHANQATNHAQLSSKMEEILAKPWQELLQQTDNSISASSIIEAYSDSPGIPLRRVVYLSYYDGDNADGDDNGFTGTDNDLLWLQVKIIGSTEVIETLSMQSL